MGRDETGRSGREQRRGWIVLSEHARNYPRPTWENLRAASPPEAVCKWNPPSPSAC
jgi:hypothetical protein